MVSLLRLVTEQLSGNLVVLKLAFKSDHFWFHHKRVIVSGPSHLSLGYQLFMFLNKRLSETALYKIIQDDGVDKGKHKI